MRYQLSQNWPVGQYVLLATSIIDAAVPMNFWSRLVMGLVPPITCLPLDQDCYARMRTVYKDAQIPVVGPGIIRIPDTGSQ